MKSRRFGSVKPFEKAKKANRRRASRIRHKAARRQQLSTLAGNLSKQRGRRHCDSRRARDFSPHAFPSKGRIDQTSFAPRRSAPAYPEPLPKKNPLKYEGFVGRRLFGRGKGFDGIGPFAGPILGHAQRISMDRSLRRDAVDQAQICLVH